MSPIQIALVMQMQCDATQGKGFGICLVQPALAVALQAGFLLMLEMTLERASGCGQTGLDF